LGRDGAGIPASLKAHGYQFINIDDGWQHRPDDPSRHDAQGRINSDSQFPDLKAL
jgi:hypothetical protein